MALDRPSTWTETQVDLVNAHTSQRLHLVFTRDAVYRAVVVELRNGMVSLLSRDGRGNWSHATVRTDEVVGVDAVPPVEPIR